MSQDCQRAWVGIDWGDQTHPVWILDDQGTRLDDFAIDHSAAGLSKLVERLRALGPIVRPATWLA